MDKLVEKLDGQGISKILDLVDRKAVRQMWNCSNDAFRYKTTLHCAEHMAKLLGHWTIQHLELYIMFCETYCQCLRKYIF